MVNILHQISQVFDIVRNKIYLPKMVQIPLIVYIFAQNKNEMSAKNKIKALADQKDIAYSVLAKRSGYELPHHLWRALDKPSVMQLGRVRKLARFLNVDMIDMLTILK